MNSEIRKPLLPLRDIVIFPSIVVPLFVGRKKSIKALEEVMKSDKSVVLVTQKNSEVDDPAANDIYSFGCHFRTPWPIHCPRILLVVPLVTKCAKSVPIAHPAL